MKNSLFFDPPFIFLLISISLFFVFILCLKWFLGGNTLKKVIDKALSRSEIRQIFILAFFIIFIFSTLFFASWLFTSRFCNGQQPAFWDALGHFFNPGMFNSNSVPNGWVLAINIFGMVFMTGMLISILSNLLERRVEKIKNGRVSYKFKNHAVIIGYDKMTISLIKQLEKKYSDIVLQTVQDVPQVRHELNSHINNSIERKITIMNGNRSSTEDLETLRVSDAKVLYLLGENNEYNHDSLNIECLKKINKILHNKQPGKELPCNVLFENQSTYAIFQQRNIQEFGSNKLIEFIPLNFQEIWAERLFADLGEKDNDNKTDSENISYPFLDRVFIGEESLHTVHLVIIGMSKMGIALGVEATHLCHFPNFVKNKRLKTRITFIDRNADKEMYFLQGRYQNLFNEIAHTFEDISNPSAHSVQPDKENNYFTDIEWHFIKGDIENPVVQQKIEDFSCEKNSLLTIAVCLNNPVAAIAAGMYLRNTVYESDKISCFDQYQERKNELQVQIKAIQEGLEKTEKEIEKEKRKEKSADQSKIKELQNNVAILNNALAPLDNEWNSFNVQILIKQDTPYSILSMLECTSKYRNVKPFGMLDNCFDINNADNKTILAKRVHYVYSYYFSEGEEKNIPEAFPPERELKEEWEKIITAEKWSNKYHTNMLGAKLRSLNIDIKGKKLSDIFGLIENRIFENLNIIAQVEHNRWNIEKLLMGFRPINEAEKEQCIPKEMLKKQFVHPDIKAFDELSENLKNVDRMITKALPLIIKG